VDYEVQCKKEKENLKRGCGKRLSDSTTKHVGCYRTVENVEEIT